MEIVVKGRRVELDEEFEVYAKRRLRFALDRHESFIQRIVVTVTDHNGPRGGADKTCLIAAQVAGMGRVVVEERGFTAVVCLDRGAQRIAYRIARLLDRLHTPASSGSPRLPVAAR
jgi:hypothetical protein